MVEDIKDEGVEGQEEPLDDKPALWNLGGTYIFTRRHGSKLTKL